MKTSYLDDSRISVDVNAGRNILLFKMLGAYCGRRIGRVCAGMEIDILLAPDDYRQSCQPGNGGSPVSRIYRQFRIYRYFSDNRQVFQKL